MPRGRELIFATVIVNISDGAVAIVRSVAVAIRALLS